MHKPEFEDLTRQLLAAGVAPRFVARTVEELSDHFQDIEADALAAGYPADEARAMARAALGRDEDLVDAVSSERSLLSFAERWPLTSQCLHSVCYCAVLPAMPFIYCAANGSAIARWSASASLGALVTGAILFSLQWFIF